MDLGSEKGDRESSLMNNVDQARLPFSGSEIIALLAV
jgi:hypothetical protein